MVIKNDLKVIDFEILQNYLLLITNSLKSKQIFPNYYKLFNIVITSLLMKNHFPPMQRLKIWMKSTIYATRTI